MAKTLKAKVYVLEKHFDGLPKEGDLKIVEEELPDLKDGEFLAEAVYLSVDPYMRSFEPKIPIGTRGFIGSQVALIKESKNPKFPVGKHVIGHFGWRTHTISNGKYESPDQHILVLPDFEGLPLSLGVGVLGMPGNTAYFGFLEICQPKAGETVVITGAAGAVGSHVGQIAKMKGCKVIGIVGSKQKGQWLTEELKFDHFIDYKTENIDTALSKLAPEGVDCYFDNVGGETSSVILNHMNFNGRIAVCGCISSYNDSTTPKASLVQPSVIVKQLRMEGFLTWFRFQDRWFEGIEENKKLIKEGKLKYRETVTEGFENMLFAFIDMLKGGNVGKAVVKV